MRTLPLLFGVTLGLATLSLSTPSGTVRVAEARPMRHQAVHALMQDLTWIEVFNAERDDLRALQAIAQRVSIVRASLLQSMGRQPLWGALQGTIGQLYAMGGINARAQEADPEIGQRVAGAIEHMRARAEQVLTRQGNYAPPPRPGDYRVPVVMAPPPVVVPLPPTANPPVYVPPAPPAYPQQPAYPPQPPVYTQPQQYPPQPYPQQPQYPPQRQYPQQPQGPAPMDPGRFAGALAQMQRLSFSDEKKNYARDLINSGNYFTCDQIAQLMRTSAFGSDQVQIGAALYRNAVDPQNFTALTTMLTFESDRQKLRQQISR